MNAVVFDGSILKMEEIGTPKPVSGETIIQVKKAGICNTDCDQ